MRRRTVVLISASAACAAVVAGSIAVVLNGDSVRAANVLREAKNTPAAGPSHANAALPACTAMVAGLNQRDRLAQLLMVNVRDAGDANAVLSSQHVGAIFVGPGTDPGLLGPSLEALKKEHPGLMVAIDDDGGRTTPFPSVLPGGQAPEQVAASGISADQQRSNAQARGQRLKDLGITVNFAPDIDLGSMNPAVGEQSYSKDASVVTKYAGSYIRGMQAAGVMPVLKHFPGIGRASGDPRKRAASTPDLSTLRSTDLVPFADLIGMDAGVMVANVSVPGLTGGNPASLSPAAMKLLRDGIGYDAVPYDGPIFTADLGASPAIAQDHDLPEATSLALAAGADVAVLTSKGTGVIGPVLDRLVADTAKGTLAGPAVDRSAARVLKFKGVCN